MIPMIIGAVGVVVTTINAVGIGATAGMGYGLGRKYGRKICELAENAEARLTGLISKSSE
ncbi:MAG: hypothetical protein CMB16_00040 [Euryarchaeota archaeon]|nr:hypothetical protein [Euryarchaeota archaeon]|tara:strand:- start:248 stop:427 length:180 start_codon:yes stop_codon:yes gene_type:complete